MTYLDAAYATLTRAGHPLHYQQITERALARNLISPQGLTPEATMGSRLYTDSKREGSRFVRSGRGIFGLAQWQPAGIESQVQRINRGVRVELAKRLHRMVPARFEALIGELLVQMGFDESTVTVTKRSGDGGIDVTGVYRAAGLTDVNAAVQVKRWQGNVQAPVVTQLRGSLEVQQQGIIITTSGFSEGARIEASAPHKRHIGLIDGHELLDLLIRHRVGVVERALQVISLDDEWWSELIDADRPVDPETSESDHNGHTPSAPKTAAASRKPAGFTLLGETYSTRTWQGVLMGVCELLARRHPADFTARALTVRGRKRQHIAATSDGMIDPRPIPGTELWLEANQSRRTVLRVVEMLLEAFGHSPDEFQLT